MLWENGYRYCCETFQTGQWWYGDHAVKFTRWQRPAVGHGQGLFCCAQHHLCVYCYLLMQGSPSGVRPVMSTSGSSRPSDRYVDIVPMCFAHYMSMLCKARSPGWHDCVWPYLDKMFRSTLNTRLWLWIFFNDYSRYSGWSVSVSAKYWCLIFKNTFQQLVTVTESALVMWPVITRAHCTVLSSVFSGVSRTEELGFVWGFFLGGGRSGLPWGKQQY